VGGGLLGAWLARERPAWASGAGWALVGFGAVALVAMLLGARVAPAALVAILAFGSAAWAWAPLRSAALVPSLTTGAAVGLATLVFSAWDAWWALPVAGILAGILLAARGARS